MKGPRSLTGKLLVCHLCARAHNGRCGQRTVRIARARFDRRGALAGVVVQEFNPVSGRYDGRRVRLQPCDWSAAWCGLLWRGRVVHVNELYQPAGASPAAAAPSSPARRHRSRRTRGQESRILT